MSEQSPREVDAALMREYLDSRAEDQRQLGQLEGATERLANEVSGLRQAMATYQGEIQRVRDNTVTKDDAVQSEKQMLENLVALRMRIKRRANALFAIAMVTLFAAIGVGAWVLKQQADERHHACVVRNNGAQAALPFYDHQIANLRAHHSDPAVIALLQTARDASQKSIVKC